MTRRRGPRHCETCQVRLKRDEVLYNDRRCDDCIAEALAEAKQEKAEAEVHDHPNWRRQRDRDPVDTP